jgi:hypothetical protein
MLTSAVGGVLLFVFSPSLPLEWISQIPPPIPATASSSRPTSGADTADFFFRFLGAGLRPFGAGAGLRPALGFRLPFAGRRPFGLYLCSAISFSFLFNNRNICVLFYYITLFSKKQWDTKILHTNVIYSIFNILKLVSPYRSNIFRFFAQAFRKQLPELSYAMRAVSVRRIMHR